MFIKKEKKNIHEYLQGFVIKQDKNMKSINKTITKKKYGKRRLSTNAEKKLR